MRQDGYYFYKKRRRFSEDFLRDTVHLIIGILISLLFAFILVYFFGMSTTVSGDSMKPALISDQKVLVNRFIYKLSQPKPGDVVIFLPNGNENTHYYMRRVVAVPGDKVLIQDGVLYVNGSPSDIVSGRVTEAGLASNELTLEQGNYFVLSDDLTDSDDSRSANIGPVESRYIIGKVWLAFPQGDSGMHMVN
ncbi:MAG: signal peptidase I [Lachnospiraceae bacterium]|nr:signal peptidase I [Lachnospiraceae bacterium]